MPRASLTVIILVSYSWRTRSKWLCWHFYHKQTQLQTCIGNKEHLNFWCRVNIFPSQKYEVSAVWYTCVLKQLIWLWHLADVVGIRFSRRRWAMRVSSRGLWTIISSWPERDFRLNVYWDILCTSDWSLSVTSDYKITQTAMVVKWGDKLPVISTGLILISRSSS